MSNETKDITIIVNGRPREVTGNKITYEDVVKLAFPDDASNQDSDYTVAYANPHGKDGTLVAGQDTVDRVSWGEDVDSSEMITKLTLARFTADGPWELEFTCEPENSASDAHEPEESAA